MLGGRGVDRRWAEPLRPKFLILSMFGPEQAVWINPWSCTGTSYGLAELCHVGKVADPLSQTVPGLSLLYQGLSVESPRVRKRN